MAIRASIYSWAFSKMSMTTSRLQWPEAAGGSTGLRGLPDRFSGFDRASGVGGDTGDPPTSALSPLRRPPLAVPPGTRPSSREPGASQRRPLDSFQRNRIIGPTNEEPKAPMDERGDAARGLPNGGRPGGGRAAGTPGDPPPAPH